MSLLDIKHAKQALAWRLKEWNIEGDHFALAASFIDDLVEKGWRMDAIRETRPAIPKVSEACRRCGCRLPDCACTREAAADDPELTPPRPSQTVTDPSVRANAIRASVGWATRNQEEAS